MQSPTNPNRQAELQQYKRQLNSFDWSYEFSDDFSVIKRNQALLVELRTTQRRIDPTGEIWLQCMPEGSNHLPCIVSAEVENG